MPSSTSVKAILNIKKYISVGFCEADAHICSSLEGVPGLIAFQSKNSGKPDELLSLLDVVPDGNMIKTVEATSTCRIQWILIYSGEKARPLLQWIKDHGSLKRLQAEEAVKSLNNRNPNLYETLKKLRTAKEKANVTIMIHLFTKEELLAYIAGEFIGDGCVSFYLYQEYNRTTYTFIISISCKNCPNLIFAFGQQFGLGKLDGTSPEGVLRLYGDNAIKLMSLIKPYVDLFNCQKKDQIDVILHAYTLIKNNQGKITNILQELQELQEIDELLRFLKRR